MRHLYIIFATLFSLLFLSGCASSNLSYEKEQLQLQVNNAHLQLHGKKLKQKNENFSTLFLSQQLLHLDDGSIVMYEKAQTDLEYQFDPTTPRSLAIIFDAKSMRKIYENTLLFGYQIVLQDNRVLNIIVSQMYDQELKMVYGMSTQKFNTILKALDPDAPSAINTQCINLRYENHPILSRWTTYKVHIVPLVVPIPLFTRL